MWEATPERCIPQLIACLPKRDEMLAYLDAFQKQVQICAFPHIPSDITKTEIERFLEDDLKNAQTFPDMLALLFATLALGTQNCVFDKCGGRWVKEEMEKERRKGDVYSKPSLTVSQKHRH
jgi:hypothetical protein